MPGTHFLLERETIDNFLFQEDISGKRVISHKMGVAVRETREWEKEWKRESGRERESQKVIVSDRKTRPTRVTNFLLVIL